MIWYVNRESYFWLAKFIKIRISYLDINMYFAVIIFTVFLFLMCFMEFMFDGFGVYPFLVVYLIWHIVIVLYFAFRGILSTKIFIFDIIFMIMTLIIMVKTNLNNFCE